MCEYETWALTLRQECRLRVFENRVLRRIFWPKRGEVTGVWRKLHNEKFNDLYSSPSISWGWPNRKEQDGWGIINWKCSVQRDTVADGPHFWKRFPNPVLILIFSVWTCTNPATIELTSDAWENLFFWWHFKINIFMQSSDIIVVNSVYVEIFM